jgi:hypothetical protein
VILQSVKKTRPTKLLTTWDAIRQRAGWVGPNQNQEPVNTGPNAKKLGANPSLSSYRRRPGQGTVLFATALLPSQKLKLAENGKPPRGQRSGTETPCGWKATVLP